MNETSWIGSISKIAPAYPDVAFMCITSDQNIMHGFHYAFICGCYVVIHNEKGERYRRLVAEAVRESANRELTLQECDDFYKTAKERTMISAEKQIKEGKPVDGVDLKIEEPLIFKPL